jgi:hypothetical protein
VKPEQKPFEYDELVAMCFLCAASALVIMQEGKYKDEIEGREMIEREVKKIIAIRWDHADKKVLV